MTKQELWKTRNMIYGDRAGVPEVCTYAEALLEIHFFNFFCWIFGIFPKKGPSVQKETQKIPGVLIPRNSEK